MTNTGTRFFVPSYLDKSDGQTAFKELADSFNVPGPLQFKKVLPGYTLTPTDENKVIRLDSGGEVFVPMDSDSDEILDPGAQIAILNFSDGRIKVRGEGSVVIVSGSDRNVIDKWKVGVLMKYNANLWLLSLGSGSSGASAVPTEPKLVNAVGGIKRATLTWEKPLDDGGFPIRGYVVEQSRDKKAWTEVSRPGVVLTTVIMVPEPGVYYFRVKAFNEVGEGNPSNVLAATASFEAPTLDHGGGSSQYVITNYDPTNQYILTSASGQASLNGNVISTARADTITLKARAGSIDSAPVYLRTIPVTGHNETRPYFCGGCNCRTDVNPHTWDCGCVCGKCDCGNSGGGQWGDCTCRGADYTVWVDDATPGGYNKWGTGQNGGDWWIVSGAPLAPLRLRSFVTGMTLEDNGLNGWVRAPWRYFTQGEWIVKADSGVFRVQDDNGKTILALSPDWDWDCFGYVWDEDSQQAWLNVHVADASALTDKKGSLRWEFVAQTPHKGPDSWPELTVHVDGEVSR